MSRGSPLQSVATFTISPLLSSIEKPQVSAIVVPSVTCDLPTQPVHFNAKWSHLNNLHLAYPNFGQPNKIDIPLGVDVLLNGQWSGPPGTPVAFETMFGLVLTGNTGNLTVPSTVASHHVATLSGDDILRKFWEIEEGPRDASKHSPEERAVVRYLAENRKRNADGRFVVPLPRDPQARPLDESRSSAVRRFLSLERSLHTKNQFEEFAAVMPSWCPKQTCTSLLRKHSTFPCTLFTMTTAPQPNSESYLMPQQSPVLASLSMTAYMSGPLSILLSLMFFNGSVHTVALTPDVSKMYRAVELIPADRDLHRFVWRNDSKEPLFDYRMTRSPSESSFLVCGQYGCQMLWIMLWSTP